MKTRYYRMGNYYDSSRMALDKKSINHNSFDERSIGNKFDNKIDDDSDDYPNDMPYFDSEFNEDELEEFSSEFLLDDFILSISLSSLEKLAFVFRFFLRIYLIEF
jgi:hypothetical protein